MNPHTNLAAGAYRSVVISEFSDASTTTYTSGTTPQQAPADSISLLLYHFSDHLTTRMTADNFASNASFEGHYPFGESWYETGMAYPSVTKKFTSYNKDTEASSAFLNYAVFRQHSARLGRFHMADPVHGATSNPQSLNRYSYGLSDPINHTDPTGMLGVKIYVPVDPGACDPFDLPCGAFGTGFGSGCDPLGYGLMPIPTGDPSDPACTTGDQGGGGGGGVDPCEVFAREIDPPPSTVVCNGSKTYASKIELRDFIGNIPDLPQVSYAFNSSQYITKKQLIINNGQLNFEQTFTIMLPRYTRSRTASFFWNFTYTCGGKPYSTRTQKRTLTCGGFI
jgi:RHS repeat-associated protein